ncbi:MAG: hypothetical protein KDC43_28135 [Saprospiraceae bacterium]|nr:hypothetical protein [Saprospiraceae bacterium]MCB0627687.1 hypothetical protein [Saprospiraceae bacterium]MCB0679148.1 hypothetical protein [Saprospiraceae bacterium]MCB0681914.1 hypothetical protein [Saprospiraceae bacterium]
MKIPYSWLLAALALPLFSVCRSGNGGPSRADQVEQVALQYFATYAEREDWDKLLSFYRSDLEFEDVMLLLELDGLEDFKEFYNWPDTGFHKLVKEEPHLILEDLLVNDSTAVGYGFFKPFYWYGTLYGEDQPYFSIVLTFDDSLRIKRQVDFIEYPVDILCRYYDED